MPQFEIVCDLLTKGQLGELAATSAPATSAGSGTASVSESHTCQIDKDDRLTCQGDIQRALTKILEIYGLDYDADMPAAVHAFIDNFYEIVKNADDRNADTLFVKFSINAGYITLEYSDNSGKGFSGPFLSKLPPQALKDLSNGQFVSYSHILGDSHIYMTEKFGLNMRGGRGAGLALIHAFLRMIEPAEASNGVEFALVQGNPVFRLSSTARLYSPQAIATVNSRLDTKSAADRSSPTMEVSPDSDAAIRTIIGSVSQLVASRRRRIQDKQSGSASPKSDVDTPETPQTPRKH